MGEMFLDVATLRSVEGGVEGRSSLETAPQTWMDDRASRSLVSVFRASCSDLSVVLLEVRAYARPFGEGEVVFEPAFLPELINTPEALAQRRELARQMCDSALGERSAEPTSEPSSPKPAPKP
jgi:hypothetical protein